MAGAVVDAPVLRGLDERARREIARGGRLLRSRGRRGRVPRGRVGRLVLRRRRGADRAARGARGDDVESELRVAEPGESFGEESTIGLGRGARPRSPSARALVAEIPVHVFRRAAAALGQGRTSPSASSARSSAARRATSCATLALTRDLPGGEPRRPARRGRRTARSSAARPSTGRASAAGEVWLVADGMVQIQTEDGERLHVRAYLGRGDFFGDAEILEGAPRAPARSRAARPSCSRSPRARSASSPRAPRALAPLAARRCGSRRPAAIVAPRPRTRPSTSSAISTASRSRARSW